MKTTLPSKNIVEGKGYKFYNQSCLKMPQLADNSIALTITSPPYWNAIDYDIHTQDKTAWHRERKYASFGDTYEDYLSNISQAFKEVYRATMEGGFCAIVIGTILHQGKHYPLPMNIVERLTKQGWEFHQDIIWNKVTGGVKRAGVYIQKPYSGYYYPNIMTEYVLLFRKPGKPRRDKQLAIAINELFAKDIANNVWHIAPVPPKTINHPCPYPLELARRILLLYSQENDTILDPFLGSGTTALASLEHKRQCIGYDTEMKYLKTAQQYLLTPPLRERFTWSIISSRPITRWRRSDDFQTGMGSLPVAQKKYRVCCSCGI